MANMWNRSVLTALLNKSELHQLWDKLWCLNIHGQRALPPLGVSLGAICRSTRLSPCLCQPCLCSAPLLGQALGLRPHSCPCPGAHRGCREEEGACVQLPTSAPKGAELLQHRRCRHRGLGWQTALCELLGPHSRKQGEREASDPSRASRAVCSFPCLFALSDLNAWADLHK